MTPDYQDKYFRKEQTMTLQEALETDHSAFVDYIKSHMSIKDGEWLGDLIETLKNAINKTDTRYLPTDFLPVDCDLSTDCDFPRDCYQKRSVRKR